MPVAVSLIRGINVGGRNMIRMEALRALHQSCGLSEVQSYVQSGNVVFKTKSRDLARVAAQIEEAIQASHGFRPAAILRSAAELQEAVARNPFAGRSGIEPNRLLVTFLAARPDPATVEKLLALKAGSEELHVRDRELYVYFPDGMGRSKLPAQIDKTLKIPGTSRNWNTVLALIDMAAKLE